METETPRPQSRSDVNEPQTKEGEAQTSAAALKKEANVPALPGTRFIIRAPR